MIEYLEKLLDDKEYGKALAYAEELLRNENSSEEMAAIYSAVLDGRVHLTDYSGAVVAGEIAVRLAREAHAWDYFGAACMNLGAAYYYLRDWEQAINAWTDFLTGLASYQKASAFEATVRYNLGLAQAAIGNVAEACHNMEQAIAAANRLGNEGFAHGIRLALVGSLLKAGDLNSIPRLLAQCEHFIRSQYSDSHVRDSGLWHMSLRIEYTFTTGRLDKARRLALRAVFHPVGRSDHQFSFHMMLARVARRRGVAIEALGHSLAARIHAERCHRHDLLTEADEFITEVSDGPVSLMQTLDEYLLHSVLPIQEELDGPI
jgi:tetratricopeptide (TPR) repeat protein